MEKDKIKQMIESVKSTMTQYTGTKTIRAAKMNRQLYNDLRGWTVPSDENPSDEGYIVEYMNDSKPNVEGFEGYISWSPAKPFEEAYKVSETFLDRLEIEYQELEDKILKLDKFLHSDNYKSLNAISQELLFKQFLAMKRYSAILYIRLCLLKYQTDND